MTLLPPAARADEGHLTASSPTVAQVTVGAPSKFDHPRGTLLSLAVPGIAAAGYRETAVEATILLLCAARCVLALA